MDQTLRSMWGALSRRNRLKLVWALLYGTLSSLDFINEQLIEQVGAAEAVSGSHSGPCAPSIYIPAAWYYLGEHGHKMLIVGHMISWLCCSVTCASQVCAACGRTGCRH